MRALMRWIAPATILICALPLFGQEKQETPPPVKNESGQQKPVQGQSMEIIVTATKTPEELVDVPASATVVTGEELRQRGTTTVAEALRDVVGIDTGEGSDNGARLPNIGMWGLKEVDALLIMVDGVPVGGPFNPSLAQVPVEDIDRIEIVKGPQGTLYGVSAFAGVINIFTRKEENGRGHVTVGGGSFSDRHLNGGYQFGLGANTSVRLFGSFLDRDGWQDRTGSRVSRGTVTLNQKIGAHGSFGADLIRMTDHQDWGTPLPYDAGVPVEGFELDRNYAIRGARMDHDVTALSTRLSLPVNDHFRFENTLGVTSDHQTAIRSFVQEFDPEGADSEGVSLKPRETSIFEDARLVSNFAAVGAHELVLGASTTHGRTKANGIGFDFGLEFGPPIDVPSYQEITIGDHRSFDDKRTFFGFYAHDSWMPVERLTVSGGGRWDRASETLHASGQEVGDELVTTSDHRSDSAFSGDLGVMYALVRNASIFDEVNVYANARSSFKPAAPNLTEAESAEILEPERTHSQEIGIKTRTLGEHLNFDVSLFHMTFDNIVVSTLGANGEPSLVNAGRERFQGLEADFEYLPTFLPSLSFTGGYAHHDARYVDFTFVTPDGELRNVSGKRVELVPRDIYNLKASYFPKTGLGVFVAARHQSRRPLTRRNTFWSDPVLEYDAGISWGFQRAMLTITGRNLGNKRYEVTESEIGDSQYYIAPPRRVTAELTWKF